MGVQHGVVEVADDRELRVAGDQDLAGGVVDPGRRGRLQQLQLDRLPDPRVVQGPGQVQDGVEVALRVGPDPGSSPTAARAATTAPGTSSLSNRWNMLRRLSTTESPSRERTSPVVRSTRPRSRSRVGVP